MPYTTSSNDNRCKVYKTFRICGNQKCKKSHVEWDSVQEVIHAKLKGEPRGVTSVLKCRSNKSEEFWIPNEDWFRKKAQKNDVVLFQASSDVWKLHGKSYRFGRVMMVLEAARSAEETAKMRALWSDFSKIPTTDAKHEITDVFTLDPQGTYRYDNAFSVEKCSENCKIIGIHVSCGALGNPFKIEADEIPSCHWDWTCPQFDSFNLRKDQLTLAQSVYKHTGCQVGVGQLKISLVRVKENYYFEKPDKKKTEYFNDLWSHFVGSKTLYSKPNYRKYRALEPANWEELFLIGEMMAAFQTAIKTLSKPPITFITRVWDKKYPKFEGSVNVSEQILKKADQDGLQALAGAVLWCNDLQDSKPSLLPEDLWTVGALGKARENKVALCSSPLRTFFHFVNQQIIVHRLLGSKDQCYNERELLGILGIRFVSPELRVASVRRLNQYAVELEYPGFLKPPETLYEAPYSIFTHEKVKEVEGNIRICIAGISCQEEKYCNRALVQFNLKKFKEFLDTHADIDHTKLKETYQISQKSPYQQNDGDTILILQPAVQLDIQISKSDAERNLPLKWRLLRIAQNRHICFTHINNPELAFKSHRKDIQELVTSQRIQRLIDEKPASRQRIFLDCIKVSWGKDDYRSGGSFDAKNSDVAIHKGSLLCIWKEISEGGNVKYIWSCHGVVRAKNEEEVKFEVCTLSQTEAGPSDGFFVEVINI